MSTIQDLIDYVRETPENSNPAVIKTIAQNLEGGGDDAITVTFTYDEETDDWSCDWEFDDLYEELQGRVETIYDPLPINVKMPTEDGEVITRRAIPLLTFSQEDPTEQYLELWVNYGVIAQYDSELEYTVQFFGYWANGSIDHGMKELPYQTR